MSKYLGIVFFVVFACLLVYLNLADAAQFQTIGPLGNVQYIRPAGDDWKTPQRSINLTKGRQIRAAESSNGFFKTDKSARPISPQSGLAFTSMRFLATLGLYFHF
jgi:hypothetical protein